MGQLRALGTGVFDQEAAAGAVATGGVSILLAGLNAAVDSLRRNLEKTSRYNPSLQRALQASIKDMGEASERVSVLVNQDILSGTYATLPGDYFALTTTSLEKGYREMFETLFPTLGQLLQQRIDRAERELHLSIALSVLILLLYAYVSIGLYYATIGSIDRLAGNARTIATGDLTVRVNLGARDELKVVGDSLNDMVGAFRGLIDNVHRGASEVLEATKKLAGSAAHVNRSSEQQSAAASTMATAIEAMRSGIERLSTNSQDANRISSRAGELSADGSRAVGHVVSEIERIAEEVVTSRRQSSAIWVGARSRFRQSST